MMISQIQKLAKWHARCAGQQVWAHTVEATGDDTGPLVNGTSKPGESANGAGGDATGA